MIKGTFQDLSKSTFISLYEALVRLHLEYGMSAYCICMYISIKGSWTYLCTLLSTRFLTEVYKKTTRETQVHKQGRSVLLRLLWRSSREVFRWALNAFTDEAITTSAGRSFHIFTSLWLKVNLRRSSLDRSFRRLSGGHRSLEVSAMWKMFCH